MTNTNIYIRFIRKNSVAKNDDTVVIDRNSLNGLYTLSYTYGDMKSKSTRKIVLADRAVFRWMRNTINLLEKDNDPFDSVQVDFPFMPSVLFDVAKLDNAYNSLLDAVEFHLDNWPSPLPEVRAAPVTLNQELEEDVYDEEDEYADMPPLVPSPIAHNNSNYNAYIDNTIYTTNYNQVRGRHHLFLD
jgi:hypothetical protein